MEEGILDYVKNNLVVSENVYSYHYSNDSYYRYGNVICPCGKSNLCGARISCDKEGNLKDDKSYDVRELSFKLLGHIERQIRMNACLKHIEILTGFIGKEKTLEKLDVWAKKNMVVALALKLYIKKSKKCVLVGEGVA